MSPLFLTPLPPPRPQDDPFWTAPGLSPREAELIAYQSVCSLEQLLTLASYHNSTVVFRLQRPPADHPCHHSWINDTLQAVLRSGIPQRLVGVQEVSTTRAHTPNLSLLRCLQVMWTPDEERGLVRQLAPDLSQTSVDKQSPRSLHEDGISRLLLRYNQASRQEVQ